MIITSPEAARGVRPGLSHLIHGKGELRSACEQEEEREQDWNRPKAFSMGRFPIYTGLGKSLFGCTSPFIPRCMEPGGPARGVILMIRRRGSVGNRRS